MYHVPWFRRLRAEIGRLAAVGCVLTALLPSLRQLPSGMTVIKVRTQGTLSTSYLTQLCRYQAVRSTSQVYVHSNVGARITNYPRKESRSWHIQKLTWNEPGCQDSPFSAGLVPNRFAWPNALLPYLFIGAKHFKWPMD
jgi:hypothetical protein